VLLLDQGFVGSPWYDAYSGAFRSAFAASSTAGVAVHVEHLDFGHFGGPQYEDHLRAYLRRKYRESPINVIVAAGPRALEFALHVRGDLGTDVPVVFSIVDDATLARLRPSNATGKILQYNLRDQMVYSARCACSHCRSGQPAHRGRFRNKCRWLCRQSDFHCRVDGVTGTARPEWPNAVDNSACHRRAEACF